MADVDARLHVIEDNVGAAIDAYVELARRVSDLENAGPGEAQGLVIVVDQGLEGGHAVLTRPVRIHVERSDGSVVNWADVAQVSWGDGRQDQLQTHTYGTASPARFITVLVHFPDNTNAGGTTPSFPVVDVVSVRQTDGWLENGNARLTQQVTIAPYHNLNNEEIPVGAINSINWGDGDMYGRSYTHTYTYQTRFNIRVIVYPSSGGQGVTPYFDVVA